MDAEPHRNDCEECAQLRQELQALREQVAKLTAALEEERRRGKRQAAPFSKGPPVAEPQPPGRKSGRRHGPHAHRRMELCRKRHLDHDAARDSSAWQN